MPLVNPRRPAPVLFFMCSGLGLVNAKRLVAIIQALREEPRGHALGISVFAWGRALSFLRSYQDELDFEIHELRSYRIRMGGWKNFLLGIPDFIVSYARNTIAIGAAVLRQRPKIALLDSDYHFLPFLLGRV